MGWAVETKALGSGTSKASSTTLATGTLSAAVAAGKQVIVSVGGLTHSTSISSVTDSKGNTYTQLADADLGISRVALYGTTVAAGKDLTTSDTITGNWASAVSTRVIEASSFTGGTLTLTGSTPTTVAGAASTSMSIGPSAGSMASGDLAFAAFVSTNATDTWAFVAGTGFTTANTATTGNTGTNRSIGSEYQIMGSAGAVTATATQTGSHAYDAVLVGLAPAGGTTFTQPVTASGTGSAAAGRGVGVGRAANATGTAVATRLVGVVRTASATGTAVATRLVGVGRSVASTGAAAAARLVGVGRSAAATGTATLSNARTLLATIGASATGTVAVVRAAGVVRAASGVGTAAASRAAGVTCVVVVTATARAVKSVGKLAAVASSAAIALAAQFVAGAGTVFTQSLAIAATGSAVASRVVAKAAASSASGVAVMVRRIAKLASATTSGAAGMARATGKHGTATATGVPDIAFSKRWQVALHAVAQGSALLATGLQTILLALVDAAVGVVARMFTTPARAASTDSAVATATITDEAVE